MTMNFLFSGIGGPTPLGVAKSVKLAFPDARLIGVDGSQWSASLYNSDIFDQTYHIESGSSEKYWSIIEEIIINEKVDFAFIIPESEVIVWSDRQSKGKLPCATLVPDIKLANLCFDKLKVAKELTEIGLSPKTEAFTAGVEQILDYPFWIRVKQGAGALGALKIENAENLNTWMTLQGKRSDLIISEYLPGRNYACKMLYVDGKLLQTASAERIEYLLAAAAPSGISGMCSRGKLLNKPDLVENSKIALECISTAVGVKLHGMFTVDFKENKNGQPLITEINIRPVSFNYAFTLGGVNFPETIVNAVIKNKVEELKTGFFEKESYFIRGVDAPLRLIP
jgi:carbamoyl-phosphate synthase large subunit